MTSRSRTGPRGAPPFERVVELHGPALADHSYREVATEAGSPAAVRAAGSALATNPLPIVVPCHRVLPASGGIGDYRGGAAAKALDWPRVEQNLDACGSAVIFHDAA